MIATRPRKWLYCRRLKRVGRRRDGRLDCEKLPNVTPDFCRRFRRWLATRFDTWPDKAFDAMPSDFNRVAHNAEGRQLAKEIRRSA